MYNEENENKNFFFRNLIVKVLLVLLFVFLLMWLFPMPNLSPFYDKIFSANINTMTDAARSYFTTSRLPQEEGETKTLTLQEMLNNKMIIAFTDSDGNSCDTNKSYVEVTKKDGEYTFKTNLSCETEEDYVITYFGCYDVCEDDSCDVEKPSTTKLIEYQFYKTTKTKLIDKYVCKSGYTLSGTKCVLKINVEKEEDATLSCSKGYTYNESTNKCEKKIVEETNPSKSCPTGYTYVSSTNKCIKEGTDSIDADYTYKCADNSTPVDGKCPIIYRTEVPADKNYSCAPGYTISEDKTKCTIEKDASIIFSCADEKTPVDGKCPIYKTVVVPGACGLVPHCSYVSYTYQMPTVNGTYFTRTLQSRTSTLYIYKECTYRQECAPSTTKTEFSHYVDAIKSYSCVEGDKVGTKCIITKTPTMAYVCSVGTMTSEGDTCLISSTVNNDAIKVYKCTVGTLNGDKCITTSTSIKNPTIYCNCGILIDGKCVITISDKKDPIYSCRTGYTKVGNSCYKFSTTTKIIDAEIVYKTTTTKVYKWSRSKTLSGWTFTGKTRTITVTA